MKDIERLRLIKRLTLEGQAIGTVAHLDVDALVVLSSGTEVASTGALRVLVVGCAAACKPQRRLRPAPALAFDDLGCGDVLIIHAPSLRASMTEQVVVHRNSLPAPNVIVVCRVAVPIGIARLLLEPLAAA